MTWARLDDNFHDHPKVDGLSLAAVGLYTLCLTWAHRHRRKAPLPGHVPAARVRKLAAGKAKGLSDELVGAGLWEREDGLGGFLIHDFGDYLPKERDPEELREAGRKGAAKRWQTDSKVDGSLPSTGMANDGSCVSAPASPTRTEQQVVLPDPTRPDPKGADIGALLAEFVTLCAERPPSRYLTQLRNHVRTLIADGTDVDALRGGLVILAERGLAASVLPGAVHEFLNARPKGSRNGHILNGAMQRAQAAESQRKALP